MSIASDESQQTNQQGEEQRKQLNEYFLGICDRNKKNKHRFNYIQESFKIIDSQPSQSSERHKEWITWLNMNYLIAVEVIQERLTGWSSSFISKLMHSSSEGKEVQYGLESLLRVVNDLTNGSITELMGGVYRNSMIHVIYCGLEYSNKSVIRVTAILILLRVISAYDLGQLPKLHELSLLTLFTYIIDFQAITSSNTHCSIRELCVFNSPASTKPPWTFTLKETSNIITPEVYYLDEVWKYMQRDVKNARKWLLILSQTWFQLSFDKRYLKWTDEYFRRADTVTKHYYLLTGLPLDQITLSPAAITHIQGAFLKQINFFFVIISTSKKEMMTQKQSAPQAVSAVTTGAVEQLENTNQLLTENEYLQFIELMQSFFDKEEFLRVSNEIISSLSDQTVGFGDAFPVNFENENIVLLSSILAKIEESIVYEMAAFAKKPSSKVSQLPQQLKQQGQTRQSPKRVECYVFCLFKISEEMNRSVRYFKTFCSKVIQIASDILNQWMPADRKDFGSLPKVLVDLFFLLMSYQERILLFQLDSEYRAKTILQCALTPKQTLHEQQLCSQSELVSLLDQLQALTIQLLERYAVLCSLSGYARNIASSFLEALYMNENMQLFSSEVVFRGQIIRNTIAKEFKIEDTLELVIDALRIRCGEKIDYFRGSQRKNLILKDVLQAISKNEGPSIFEEDNETNSSDDNNRNNFIGTNLSKNKNKNKTTDRSTPEQLAQEQQLNYLLNRSGSGSLNNSFYTNSYHDLKKKKNSRSFSPSMEQQYPVETTKKSGIGLTVKDKLSENVDIKITKFHSSQEIENNIHKLTSDSQFSHYNNKHRHGGQLTSNDTAGGQQSSAIHAKQEPIERKLEQLTTHLLIFLTKAEFLCSSQTSSLNSVLSAKYSLQFMRLFQSPEYLQQFNKNQMASLVQQHDFCSLNYTRQSMTSQQSSQLAGNIAFALSQVQLYPVRISPSIAMLKIALNPLLQFSKINNFQSRNPNKNLNSTDATNTNSTEENVNPSNSTSNSAIQSIQAFEQNETLLIQGVFHWWSKMTLYMTIGGEGNQDDVVALLNECLNNDNNDLLSIICVVACRDIIIRYPKIITSHPKLVNQLLEIAQKALQLILAPNSGLSDLYLNLGVLLARSDFKCVMAAKIKRLQQQQEQQQQNQSQNGMVLLQPPGSQNGATSLVSSKQSSTTNMTNNYNNNYSFDSETDQVAQLPKQNYPSNAAVQAAPINSNVNPSNFGRDDETLKHKKVPSVSNETTPTSSSKTTKPPTTSTIRPKGPSLPIKLPSNIAENLIQASKIAQAKYNNNNSNNTTITNKTTQNSQAQPQQQNNIQSDEDSIRKIRSSVVKSVVILLKNVCQITEIHTQAQSQIQQILTILADNFTLYLELGSQGLMKLFSSSTLVHLQALFFIVLLDKQQTIEMKGKIWEYILGCLSSGGYGLLVSESIQFLDSFALADQLSQIPKQVINKVMRVITHLLQEIDTQAQPHIARQLLNCLQSWIFNFRYFEINCRKHFKDTKKFLENLIKALHVLAMAEELQPDVQFFLSQLLKNYLHQNQDSMFRFTLDNEEFQICEDHQIEPNFNIRKQQQNIFNDPTNNNNNNDMNLALVYRESIYQTVSCNDSMKAQQHIFSEISKIEREVLKSIQPPQGSSQIPQSLACFVKNNTFAVESKQKKSTGESSSQQQLAKSSKKRSSQQVQEMQNIALNFSTNRYMSLSVNGNKLLSFLIDTRKQIFAILRDANGKFIWKIPEIYLEENNKNDEDTAKNTSDNKIKTPSTSSSKASDQGDIKKQSLKDNNTNNNNSNTSSSIKPSIQQMIEQVVYYIHESIAKAAHIADPLGFLEPESNEFGYEVRPSRGGAFDLIEHPLKRIPTQKSTQSQFETQASVPRFAASQLNLTPLAPSDFSDSETISRSISAFLKEVPFVLSSNEKCCFIDHKHMNFLSTITQIDQYSTSDKVKIGVVYMGLGKSKECDILQSSQGSELYESFLSGLGEKVNVSNHIGFLGGLSSERDGEQTVYNHLYNCEIIYHVATLMPTKHSEDKQCVSKKRHIGNDFVNIIWNETNHKFIPTIIPSQLTTAYVVIEPLSLSEYYSVTLIRKDNLEDYFFPWLDKTVVHKNYLEILVRIVSLQARNHKNILLNVMRPFKSRQSLLQQLEEQLSLPGYGTSLISDVFTAPSANSTEKSTKQTMSNSIDENPPKKNSNPNIQTSEQKIMNPNRITPI